MKDFPTDNKTHPSPHIITFFLFWCECTLSLKSNVCFTFLAHPSLAIKLKNFKHLRSLTFLFY